MLVTKKRILESCRAGSSSCSSEFNTSYVLLAFSICSLTLINFASFLFGLFCICCTACLSLSKSINLRPLLSIFFWKKLQDKIDPGRFNFTRSQVYSYFMFSRKLGFFLNSIATKIENGPKIFEESKILGRAFFKERRSSKLRCNTSLPNLPSFLETVPDKC